MFLFPLKNIAFLSPFDYIPKYRSLYLEWTGDPIPFEAFLALALDHLNLAAYQQGEELKKMQEGHTKKPIVPADEFYAVKKRNWPKMN